MIVDYSRPVHWRRFLERPIAKCDCVACVFWRPRWRALRRAKRLETRRARRRRKLKRGWA